MKVSFLIAAHNEVATIRDVLDRIRALPLDAQIVAVDDGSTDGTAEAIESWREEHGDVVLLREVFEEVGPPAPEVTVDGFKARLRGLDGERVHRFATRDTRHRASGRAGLFEGCHRTLH